MRSIGSLVLIAECRSPPEAATLLVAAAQAQTPFASAPHRLRATQDRQAIFLLVLLAVTVDRDVQGLGQGVHDGHADAVQATRDLVRRVVELAPACRR